jgi:hypothetical protein
MSRPFLVRLLVAHFVASYAGMLTLILLSWELDHRIYPTLPLYTVIAPVGAPILVVRIVAGVAHLNLLAAFVVVVPYFVAFVFLMRLKRRHRTEGFPVLPSDASPKEME